ncbi:MAG: NAD(P)/FAD-dependent oxidoreductase [Acidobacteria bacterium]|nr:NAD(P)/FAD-dependent oxidoreductase [Acidobacteriota bacterium]
MDRCDVLVVGGGPAGSSCAWKLGQAGVDVLVVDRAAFPRDKPCAGWITPQVLDALVLDPADYRGGRVFQAIRGFQVGCGEQDTIEIRYDAPVSFGIRRSEFDHYLLQRCGARFARVGVTSLRRAPDGWIVNERIAAPVIVGAGGHFCPVARAINGTGQPSSVVVAQEVELYLSGAQASACAIHPEMPALYFAPDLNGYGWCFRKENFLNIGLGRLGHAGLRHHVGAFVRFLQRTARIPADLPIAWKGHAYLLSRRPSVVADRVLLVGDSAGLAYAESGEGIRPAIESGILAAETLLRAKGDYRAEALAPYRRAIDVRFGSSEPGLSSYGFVPPRALAAVASWLLGQRWFTRRVVIDRWFLHSHVPPLAAATPAGVRRAA